MEVYVDTKHLRGGDFVDKELPKALCESVCLVVVYTPIYFNEEKTYCAREYRAMELLEEERKEALRRSGLYDGHGLIIPIVYRGKEEKLPKGIKSRLCHLFQNFHISRTDTLDNPEYAYKITEIAEYIAERCNELRCVEDILRKDCDRRTFPPDEEIYNWLEGMLSPKLGLPSREEIK